ncbi:MAG: hypothetical protein ABIP77_00845 [Candidatus Limnocylindrales bacterium]
MRRFILTAAASAMLVVGVVGPVAAHDATCSGSIGTEVHGQHVLGLYVVGGQLALDSWPPTGGVGQSIAGEGAALPGGPGPAFHFLNGFAPGASFCTDSRSPGAHF